MEEKLKKVSELQDRKDFEGSLELMLELLNEIPMNPYLNYRIAWTYDSLAKSRLAIPFYIASLTLGLKEERPNAIVGLGSCYRSVGEYENALKILEDGLVEFPENRSIRMFRSILLNALEKNDETVDTLIALLKYISEDGSIQKFEKALRVCADRSNIKIKDEE